MTYWYEILQDLRAARERGSWYCGSWWLAKEMPSYAQRISLDLKPRGYVVESKVCEEHPHRSTVHAYRLLKEPQAKQLALVG